MQEETPVGRVLAELLGTLSAGVQYLLEVDRVRLERLREVVVDAGHAAEYQQLERQITHVRELLDNLARLPERLAPTERSQRAADSRATGDPDAS